jgi:peptidoglycan hydrolase-like protein with peptidoglycan-binding domain
MKKYTLFLSVLAFVLFNINVNSASAVNCASGDLFNTITGQACSATSTVVACPVGDLFSSVTGQRCTTVSGGSSSSTSVSPSRLLTIGSIGDDVRSVQQILKDQGYSVGTVDGNYGKRTARVVSEFQGDNDLAVTGNVDATTLAMLRTFGNITTNPTIPPSTAVTIPSSSVLNQTSYQSLPTDSSISGTASLVSANEDVTFKTDYSGQVHYSDWKWSISLVNSGSVQKTVKRMILVHNAAGEGWATDDSNNNSLGKNLRLLATTLDNGTFLIYSNNLGMIIPANGSKSLFAYGAPASQTFSGGSLIVEFTDGTRATINIPASSIIPSNAGTPTSVTQLSCSSLQQTQQYYYNSCKNNGFENVCFSKDGVYQGCGNNSNNDCTVNNMNASNNVLCSVGATSPTIIVSNSTGGTIYPSGNISVSTGSNKTFTFTPNAGYQVRAITIDNSVSAPVASSYTFYNVTGSHIIGVSFSPLSTSTLPSITILSPNGGETYKYGGDTMTVNWVTANVASSQRFDVMRLRGYPNGGEYNLITSFLNDGQEVVSIPSSIPVGAYTLEIKTYVNDVLVMDSSDSYFKIVDTTTAQSSITGTQSITPSISTINSGGSVKFNFTFPSNTVRASLYLSCPVGVTEGGSKCNQYTDITSNTDYTVILYNSSSQSQNVVPNYYVYTSDNPSYAKGVSSQVSVQSVSTATTASNNIYHSADYNHDWKIDGTELNRVLSYQRAGGYHIDSTGYDGFAAGYDGNHSGLYHSADYNHDWLISQIEADRVLSYWRAGGYKVQTGTEDGFATDSVLDIQAPSVPSNATAVYIRGTSSTSSGSVKITWNASTDNTRVAGYNVYRNGLFIVTTKETFYTDSNPPNISLTAMLSLYTDSPEYDSARVGVWKYTISAYDVTGNVSNQSSVASIKGATSQ